MQASLFGLLAPPLALLALLALLAQPVHSATLMSKAQVVPADITNTGEASADQTITLQILPKFQNEERLEQVLADVSDPASPLYGRYLDTYDLEALFMPAPASTAAVMGWLANEGVTDVANFGWYINFATTVGKANAMLGSTFLNFVVDGQPKVRAMEYYLPDEVAKHVALVTPTTFIGRTKSLAPTPLMPADKEGQGQARLTRREPPPECSKNITPSCLENMYNFGNYQEDPASGSRIGFGSFLKQASIPSDLTMFQTQFDLPIQALTTVFINDAVNHTDRLARHNEANLDACMMAAVGRSLPMTEFLTGGKPPLVPNLMQTDDDKNTNEPYLEFYLHLLELPTSEIPQVISISYGDEEQTVPKDYAERTCYLMAMMGMRGITILHSSGDSGVGATCQSNDGLKTPELTPQFPSSCPYVTSVGGTQSYGPEVVWPGTGGGFSNYFKQSSYQASTIKKYLRDSISAEAKDYLSSFVDFTGRAYPDIAAHSSRPSVAIMSEGRPKRSGGTSASAPIVGGIIGLINDARLRAGMPVMGFINPWLYSTGYQGLIDVVEGQMTGCNGVNYQTGRTVVGASIIPWAGYNATEGWDPATGLGLPDLEALIDLALHTP